MLRPFTITSRCVAGDEELYAHISSALTRKLPVLGQHYAHDGVAVLVGSGPSVLSQLDALRAERARGRPLIALKDAHDWMISHDLVPDYAVAIDPKASRAHCFTTPHPAVKYLIASQVHPDMFDHLSGYQVFLWHAYVRKNQSVPPHGTPLISGGTTTGLRSITLFYSLGYRHVELYGYDSCLTDGVLRLNGTRPPEQDDTISEIVVGVQAFQCNPSMVGQATEFQNLYWSMPDLEIHAHGPGLIAAIIAERNKMAKASISFNHAFGPTFASYRYRAAIPARQLGASLNDPSAQVQIYVKPTQADVVAAQQAKQDGKRVIVDICDDHLNTPVYHDILVLADVVTCSSEVLRGKIAEMGYVATVIDDPYEFDELSPHCGGGKLLWFGHAVNLAGINRILPELQGLDVRIVSNAIGAIPWSLECMPDELALADIVLMPATKAGKSCNRTVEAIRRGCFVVAEPHPSLTDIPGIWVGDINEGVQWALQHPQLANERTGMAQQYVKHRFSPRTVASAWSRLIQDCLSTSGRDVSTGLTGSTLISVDAATLSVT